MSRRIRIAFGLGALAVVGCATAPATTEATKRIAANQPALVEGIVRDSAGRPVPGIGVRGVPLGKDVPWSAPAFTACDGTFRLFLAAPAAYGFLLVWNGAEVLTPGPEDPSRVQIAVAPGQKVEAVELVFLVEDWRRAGVAAEIPACR